MTYFSDRNAGAVARTHEDITEAAWGGILASFERRVDSGAFGFSFPDMCEDGAGPSGTNARTLRMALRAEIPAFEDWPRERPVPPLGAAFDLVEFTHAHVGEPEQQGWHSYMQHHHLRFDQAVGQSNWRTDVNRVLERSGIAFELRENGQVERLLPPAVAAVITAADFNTQDAVLDALLEEARVNFINRSAAARRHAVEQLWDAFERAKSLRDPSNKKVSTRTLLDESSSTPEFRQVIEDEALALTGIGNNFRIRHSEVSKTELNDQELDYVFARMYALVWLVLRER